jgi:hypothetical protein
MASTYSPLLRLELIAAGEQAGLWGNTTNENIGTLIEQALAGCTTIALTSTGDRTLVTYNGAPDEARAAALLITGTPGGTTNIIVPASQKQWLVKNSTPSSVVIKTSAQVGGVTIVAGGALPVFCDGTNVYGSIDKIAIAQGGTGASTAAAARTALDVPQTSGTGATGTWPIGISGNASSATTAANAATVTNGVYTTDLSTTGAANKVPKYDGNGNIGLGVTAIAGTWAGGANQPTWGCEFGKVGFIASSTNYQNDILGATYTQAYYGTNLYHDGTDWRIKYAHNTAGTFGRGAFISVSPDVISFSFAASAAVGAVPTFTTPVTFNAAGQARATSFTTTSDRRLKRDLECITGALEKVNALRGYTYVLTPDETANRHMGLIAQDVIKVAPETVTTGEDGYMAVSYGALVALLVESIKELEARVRSLEG